MNTFKFVGQIKKLDEKNDRKYIETKKLDSGWIIKRVKFRMNCGETSQFVDVSGGKWDDESKNVVYTYMTKEGTTNDKSVEKAQVAWNDRFKADIIERVPHYRRYTIDLASDKLRKKLTEEGKTEEATALADKKYVYISVYDFVSKVEELLTSGAFGDKNYVVTGTVECNYTFNKQGEATHYFSFVPTNIYLASENDEPSSVGKIDFYYNPDNYLGYVNDKGDIPVSGYMQYYDSMAKGSYFAPRTLFLKNGYEKNEGLKNLLSKQSDATDGAEVVVLGLDVEYYNGSPKVDITIDDLQKDDKDLIEWGLKTFEDIKKEKGDKVYEDRVSCIYIQNIARGYSAPQNPDITLAKLEERPVGKKDKNGAVKKAPAKPVVDLFADDDEYDTI